MATSPLPPVPQQVGPAWLGCTVHMKEGGDSSSSRLASHCKLLRVKAAAFPVAPACALACLHHKPALTMHSGAYTFAITVSDGELSREASVAVNHAAFPTAFALTSPQPSTGIPGEPTFTSQTSLSISARLALPSLLSPSSYTFAASCVAEGGATVGGCFASSPSTNASPDGTGLDLNSVASFPAPGAHTPKIEPWVFGGYVGTHCRRSIHASFPAPRACTLLGL